MLIYYMFTKNFAKSEFCFCLQDFTHQIGGATHQIASRVDEYARGMFSAPGSTLFEELELYYIGPINGQVNAS